MRTLCHEVRIHLEYSTAWRGCRTGPLRGARPGTWSPPSCRRRPPSPSRPSLWRPSSPWALAAPLGPQGHNNALLPVLVVVGVRVNVNSLSWGRISKSQKERKSDLKIKYLPPILIIISFCFCFCSLSSTSQETGRLCPIFIGQVSNSIIGN